MTEEKAPSDYLPVVLKGVVGEEGLRALLSKTNQKEWMTRKRVSGLLMILSYLARRTKASPMSSELSRQYVSTHKRAKNSKTIRQPLALLIHLDLIEVAQEAIITPHRKQSARYRISPRHGKPRPIEINLSRQQREKLANADNRLQTRLNRKHRTRSKILADLACVALSSEGSELAIAMMGDGEKEQCVKRFTKTMRDTTSHKLSYDPSGTIHHYVMQCPRELKPHITLHGKPVAICDMKSAHLCALLCVARGRVMWLKERNLETEAIEVEITKLKLVLETGDIYLHLAEGEERKTFKRSLLASLNTPTQKAIHMNAYKRLKANFPRITRIIEDIKKNDHRSLSKQLQFFTAEVIEEATFQAQSQAIPCLPDTDALIVPFEHEKDVRRILNESLHQFMGLSLACPDGASC